MVQEREFRADLYYRLNVFPIVLPPLRERILDIPLLAWHFVEQFARRQGKSIKSTSPDEAMEMLKRYDWPGQYPRELQNLIERAVIRTSGSELRLRAMSSAVWSSIRHPNGALWPRLSVNISWTPFERLTGW